MLKQFQHSDMEVYKIINFAQHLRKKFVIPSLELENFLNFQYAQMIPKTIFNCCSIQKTFINKSFKRAFRSMNKLQQARYYSRCVKLILNELYPLSKPIQSQERIEPLPQSNSNSLPNNPKFQQLTILYKKQGTFQKWLISKVQIATEICVMRLIHTGQEIDLNHYLLRQSKSKKKCSLVLESMDQIIEPVTLRVSNYADGINVLREKLEFYIEKALKMKIARMFKKNRMSGSTQCRKSIQAQISVPYKQVYPIDNQNIVQNPKSLAPATILIAQGITAKSLRSILSLTSQQIYPPQQIKKIYKKLLPHQAIFSLQSFKDFQQICVSPPTFFNKQRQITRKIFTFSQDEISLQWLITQMNCYKMFKKWKQSLFLINLLAELPQQKTKIYHEINLYKDYREVDYVYLRHLFQIQGVNYFVDKSINTEEYGGKENLSRGNIEYCLWRFRKVNNSIQVFVQIQLKNINAKNIAQISTEYIGDVYLLKYEYLKDKRTNSQTFKSINNVNLFLFEDQSELNGGENSEISSPFKKRNQTRNDSGIQLWEEIHAKKGQNKREVVQKQTKKNKRAEEINFPTFLQQDELQFQKNKRQTDIQQLQRNHMQTDMDERESTQYYSLPDSQDDQNDSQPQNINDFNSRQKQIVSQQQLSINQYHKKLIFENDQNSKSQSNNQSNSQPISVGTFKSLDYHRGSVKYLFIKHSIQPKIKTNLSKMKKCTLQNGHFLWKKQWKITEKGELINVNQEQIKVQSSVLKLVLKKMGRNLLSGKSILNMSLPIEIFACDSNLQRLCKSMAYAPLFLQKAAQLQSPIERMKLVICFSLGYSLLYIQMQKPFNPIIGQTYQGFVDGCPLYGEQISHHPPISSIYFKGRGYTAYGNFQAKVQMGMNSASGINEGFMNVAFNAENCNPSHLKFNCPPGQISGLVYGQRKLTLIRKSYCIDEKNMILGIIEWGSQKKKNQISFNNDYLEGKIVKLKPGTDLHKLDKIKQVNFQKVLCHMKGRWTGRIQFEDQVLFDIEKDGPFYVEQDPYSLKSNVNQRDDIKLRKQMKWSQAQQAKQKLQQLQRNDRKLRKHYEKQH